MNRLDIIRRDVGVYRFKHNGVLIVNAAVDITANGVRVTANNGFDFLFGPEEVYVYDMLNDTTAVHFSTTSEVRAKLSYFGSVPGMDSTSGSGSTDINPILDKMDAMYQLIQNSSFVEFDIERIIPADSDTEIAITPVGSEIREYQIFDKNTLQDVTDMVSTLGTNPNELLLFAAVETVVLIKGKRTKV